MSITSFYFLCFFAAMLGIYYIIPKKMQWMFLLLCSLIYYVVSGNYWLILYPVGAAAANYAAIRIISAGTGSENKDNKKRAFFYKRLGLFIAVAGDLGVRFVLKYVNFGINTYNGIAGLLGGGAVTAVSFLVPLGVSFYSFSLLGYVIDVYNGIAQPQKNFLKLALYGMYFPVMISGPILKYREDGQQFYEPHYFNYGQVTFGIQRMLWGFFKKLVISERMGMIVNTVYGDYVTYPGAYIFLATVCYAFQLYTDFSGCMDIVLGMSQALGLKLPENFERPFFAQTISEYWRRWHITLGVWMKEYVFYPLLRTRAFTSLNGKLKKRLGKKRGKQINTFIAMFILWFTVGLWHGGDWKYIIGSGLLHWAYIVTGELLQPFLNKCTAFLRLNPQGKFLTGLRRLRTFFLVCIGFVFFRAATLGDAVAILKASVSTFNLYALFTGTVFTLGLDWVEFIIAAVSLIILLVVSVLQEKGSVREKIAAKKLPVRWIIWYALLFYTILLGYYGPGYSAAEFIYQGF